MLYSNSFKFMNLFTFLQEFVLSQLEVDHVIDEPTAKKIFRCRAPLTEKLSSKITNWLHDKKENILKTDATVKTI